MKIKLFNICSNGSFLLKDDVYESIIAGSSFRRHTKGFLYDDSGDNISKFNRTYNELTAIYWVYTHLDNFKDIEYFGFVHYRRHFIFKKEKKFVRVVKKFDKSFVNVEEDRFLEIINHADFVIPYPNYTKSVKDHFLKSHATFDLSRLEEIISTYYSDYLKSYNEYMNGNKEYLYNMFIFDKKTFIEYCQFIFGVLSEYKKTNEIIDRLYISERLTGVFIHRLITNGKKPYYLPVLLTRTSDIRSGINQYKNDSKNHKEYGFIFKTKSIWLNLLTVRMEEHLRNKGRKKACKHITTI